MIGELIDIPIKRLMGIGLRKSRNPESKVWRGTICYNGMVKSLGVFNDPFSASLVYWLVKEEIHGNKFEDRYISYNDCKGYYQLRKRHHAKIQIELWVKRIEEARAERDLLEKYDWNLEKVCECADETFDNKIIFNNHIVGVKS